MVTRRAFIGSVAGALVVGGVGGYFGRNLLTPSTGGIDPVLGFTGLSLQTAPPRQPDHEVQLNIRPRPPVPIPEVYFDPTGLLVQPGQTVKFSAVTPHHSISDFHPLHGRDLRVPDGVPAFSSPVLPIGSYWLYTFEKEGVYDLFCGPHEYFGMVMRVVVGSATGPGASPPPPPIPLPEEGATLPPLLTGAAVLRDPALDGNNIVQKGKVTWDELNADSKKLLLALAP